MSTTNNPFVFTSQDAASSGGRKLDFTPALIARANERASNLMMQVANNPELHELANRMIDEGQVTDLLELIDAVYKTDDITADAAVLDGADEDQLTRLLASRQSDRSKAKAKGLRQSAVTCTTYISAMYAELLVRVKLDRPYQAAGAPTAEIDTTDLEAIKRRVKSLQTKTCRLRKLAPYDETAALELEEAEAEITRLNSYRPSARVASKTTIADIEIDQLRKALELIDTASLEKDEAAKLEALRAKLA